MACDDGDMLGMEVRERESGMDGHFHVARFEDLMSHLPVVPEVEPATSLRVPDDLVRGVDPPERLRRVLTGVNVRVRPFRELPERQFDLRLARVHLHVEDAVRVSRHGSARPVPVPSAACALALTPRGACTRGGRAETSPREGSRRGGDPPCRRAGHQ